MVARRHATVSFLLALSASCGPDASSPVRTSTHELPPCPGGPVMHTMAIPPAEVAWFCAQGYVTCAMADGAAVSSALFCKSVEPTPTPTATASAPVADPPPPPPLAPRGLARKDGGPADALLVEGDAAMATGDFALAEKKYRDAANKAPKDPAPIVGGVRARLGKAKVSTEYAGAPKSPVLKAALTDLARARKLDPSYAPAALEVGRAQLVLGDAKEAEAALAKAVELDPSDPEAHSARGVAAIAVGDVEAAAKLLARAAELDPGSAERQGNLGTALLVLGRVDEAVVAYRRARRIAPTNARVASDLGASLLQQGKMTEALPILEEAVKLAPEKATFRNNLGYARYLANDFASAEADFAEAVRLDPKLVAAWVNRANAAAKQKRTTEAWGYHDKAKAIDAEDPRVLALEAELREISPR